jgi:hypothetical protein
MFDIYKRGRLLMGAGKGDGTCAGRGLHDRNDIFVLRRMVKALGEPVFMMEGHLE